MKHNSKLTLFWAFWFIVPCTFAQVTFENISAGLEGDFIAEMIVDYQDNIYSYTNSGLWKSSDQGKTWQLMNAHPPQICFMEADEAGNLYIGFFSVFRSTDQGRTWHVFVPSLWEYNKDTRKKELVHLDGMNVRKDGTLYLRYYSLQIGSIYQRVSEQGKKVEFLNYDQYLLAFADETGNTYKFDSTNGTLSQSKDGVVWKTFSFGQPILRYGTSSKSHIMVQTSSAVYYSKDEGRTFSDFTNLPPNFCFTCNASFYLDAKGKITISWRNGIDFSYSTADEGKTWQVNTLSYVRLSCAKRLDSEGNCYLYGYKYKPNEATGERIFENKGYLTRFTPNVFPIDMLNGKRLNVQTKTWMGNASEIAPYQNTPSGLVGVFRNATTSEYEIYLSQDKGKSWQLHKKTIDMPFYVTKTGLLFLYKRKYPSEAYMSVVMYDIAKQAESFVPNAFVADGMATEIQISEGKSTVYCSFKMGGFFGETILLKSIDAGKTWVKLKIEDASSIGGTPNIIKVIELSEQEQLWTGFRNNTLKVSADGLVKQILTIPQFTADYLPNTGYIRSNYFKDYWVDAAQTHWALRVPESEFDADKNPSGEVKPQLIYSMDAGKTWTAVKEDFGGYELTKIWIDDDGYLLVATQNGAYRTKNALNNSYSAVIPDKIATMQLEVPFPNPTSNYAQIRFSLAMSQTIKLSIINQLGQEIEVVAEGEKVSGTHQFLWQPTQVASGMYIVRLEAGGVVQTKRVVVVR